jgi:hypothetical protein
MRREDEATDEQRGRESLAFRAYEIRSLLNAEATRELGACQGRVASRSARPGADLEG